MADSKIVITHNFQRLSSLLKGLGSTKDVQKAVARSIRRTLPGVQRKAFQELRAKKILKLKASELKTRARAFTEGNASTPVSRQYGKLWITPKPESLGRFFPRRVAAGRSNTVQGQRNDGSWLGVRLHSVKLNQYGQPHLKDPKRSFIVDRKGGKIVFRRVSAKRLPIEKQFGPGLAQLVQQTGIITRIASYASRRYQVEFGKNVEFYAEKALKKALAGR